MRSAVQHAARLELARRYLLRPSPTDEHTPVGFAPTVYPRYRANWHHYVIADALQRVADDRLDRLIISMPPRMGKTFLASELFPAWYLGRHPHRHVIAASATDILAKKFSRRVQRFAQTDAYRATFPRWDFGESKQANAFYTVEGGGFKAVGVGSQVSGFGAHLLVLDDLVKSREEAESANTRARVWDWLQDDAITRLQYPGAIVIIGTRWHYDDPIGRILAEQGDEWEHVILPFIAEDDTPDYDPREPGEPLWPDFFRKDDEVATAEVIQARVGRFVAERSRNAYGWSALYQCQPSPKEGGLFQRDAIAKYTNDPRSMAGLCSRIIISVDASFKGSTRADPVSMVVVGKYGPNLVVLDEVNRRMDFHATKQAIIALRDRWPTATVVIETKANGPALISDLRRSMPRVIGYDPGTDSKSTRAQLLADMWNGGQVLLPTGAHCPWVGDFAEDFIGFGARKHDDRVDALSQAAHFFDAKENPLDALKRVVGGFAGSPSFSRRW